MVSTYFGRLEIDTDKLRCDIEYFNYPNEKRVRHQFALAGSQKVVRILDGNNDHCQLEILDSHQKEIQTLIEYEYITLFPSPNGKLVAVRHVDDDKKEMIWVIDQSAQVVAKIKTQK